MVEQSGFAQIELALDPAPCFIFELAVAIKLIDVLPFGGDQKRFNQPVAVSLIEGVRTIGFMTQEDLGFLSMAGHVAVYLPFSYSMAGGLIVVPSSRVEKLPMDSASVMALVVSGGVSRVTA